MRGNQFVDNTGQAVDLGRTGPDALDALDADDRLNTAAGVHGARDPQMDMIAITGELTARGSTTTPRSTSTASPRRRRRRPSARARARSSAPPTPTSAVASCCAPRSRTRASMALVVDDYGRTSEASLVCSAQDGSSDQDGDALCDDWETDGIDYDADGTIDADLYEADPREPDVYLEIDYTEGDFWGLGGDAAPSRLALDMVEEALRGGPAPDSPAPGPRRGARRVRRSPARGAARARAARRPARPALQQRRGRVRRRVWLQVGARRALLLGPARRARARVSLRRVHGRPRELRRRRRRRGRRAGDGRQRLGRAAPAGDGRRSERLCRTSTSAARACRRRCSRTSSGTRSASSTRAVSSRPTT